MARVDVVARFPNSAVAGVQQIATRGGQLAPRVIPAGQNNKITDLGQAYDIATRVPGFKVIITPSTKAMTFLGVGITVKAFNEVEGQATLGLATGGTWEPARYALGMPDFLKETLGMALPLEKLAAVGTLDDYAYPLAIYRALERLIGTEAHFVAQKMLPWSYRGEQLTWLRRIGFPEHNFISPPQQYTCSSTEAALRFRQDLDSHVRPTRVQFHGAGTDGHDGFDEPVDDPAFLASLSPAQKVAILLRDMPTRFVVTTGLTKIQNCFAFITPKSDPEEQKLFDSIVILRNIGGAYGLLSIESIVAKARQIKTEGTKPEKFDYIPDEKWQYYMEHLEDIIARAMDVIAIMPSGAFTQGISDLRESCGVQTSALDLVMVNGGHKRNATWHVIEGDLDPRWPASAFQTYQNALVIVEETAAAYLQHRGSYFRFEPDSDIAQRIEAFDSGVLDARFWGKPLPK